MSLTIELKDSADGIRDSAQRLDPRPLGGLLMGNSGI
jgi:hypothetical protein